MISDFFENYLSKINLFDSIFLILMFYNILTCFLKRVFFELNIIYEMGSFFNINYNFVL